MQLNIQFLITYHREDAKPSAVYFPSEYYNPLVSGHLQAVYQQKLDAVDREEYLPSPESFASHFQ